MIVAIHQPAFLPWLGYLNRMVEADLFVVLDHVQFERAHFENRTRIRGRALLSSPDGSRRVLAREAA